MLPFVLDKTQLSFTFCWNKVERFIRSSYKNSKINFAAVAFAPKY